jgi:hypothetical protein
MIGERDLFPCVIHCCHVRGWFWFSVVHLIVYMVAVVRSIVLMTSSESVYVFTLLFKYLIAALHLMMTT